jgi:hypothetical protein
LRNGTGEEQRERRGRRCHSAGECARGDARLDVDEYAHRSGHQIPMSVD